ncbi:MAG: FecR domain-containing protein [Spirochaetaceae bacterium]|nr:FecR domain-containing protein [Spirochaetaceae bacterium]
MSVIKKILVAAVMCCVFASLAAMEVKVVEVSGKVEVQRDNKWVAVVKGDILPAGSVISTGFKSEAVLSFDETVIKVKALTRLTIEQLFEKDGDKASSVYLDTGSISADVKPAENKRVGFAVKTPAATASVRGTSGDVYSDGRVIGTSGRWCITGPQERYVAKVNMPAPVAQEASEEGQTPATEEQTATTEETTTTAVETESGEAVQTEPATTEPAATEPAATEPVQAEPVVETPAPGTVSYEEAGFDFSYPNDLGAVFVNQGESVAVSNGSFVTPQDGMIIKTSGSSSVKLPSETESVAPSAPQVAGEGAVPSSTTVAVPEKPKYGTVHITITLP